MGGSTGAAAASGWFWPLRWATYRWSLVPGVVAMTALAGLSGVFLAPALACAFVVVDRHAPSGTVTEAFSWLVTTFGVGAAAGTAVVGPVIERGGAAAGFGVAGAGGIAALLVLLVTARALSVTPSGSQRAPAPDLSQVLAMRQRRSQGRKMIAMVPPNPVSELGVRRNVQSWTAEFSGWRTSTASRVRSGDSAACHRMRWRGTSSVVSCHGAAAATSSCATVPVSTWMWVRTRNTRLPSATT